MKLLPTFTVCGFVLLDAARALATPAGFWRFEPVPGFTGDSSGNGRSLTNDGDVLLNEIAPRVHNSGHYTIEACKTSQFEQHIRAITGMPLGDTEMLVSSAVMINILGERNGKTRVEGTEKAEAKGHTTVHMYGKSPTKIDRKMGHLTTTAETREAALEQARAARKEINV